MIYRLFKSFIFEPFSKIRPIYTEFYIFVIVLYVRSILRYNHLLFFMISQNTYVSNFLRFYLYTCFLVIVQLIGKITQENNSYLIIDRYPMDIIHVNFVSYFFPILFSCLFILYFFMEVIKMVLSFINLYTGRKLTFGSPLPRETEISTK